MLRAIMVSPEPRPGLHGQVHEEEVAACATTHGSCTLPSRGNGLRFSSAFSCRESNVRAEDGFFPFFFTRNGPPIVLMDGFNVGQMCFTVNNKEFTTRDIG